MPIINLRQQLQITAAFSQSCQYPPMSVGFTNATGGITSLDPVTVTVTTASTLPGAVSTCRWYYRELKYQPKIAEAIANKLKSGFVKEFTYIDTNTYYFFNNSQTNINDLIISNVIAPTRVWLLCYPAGAITTQLSNSPLYLQPVQFTSANLQVNGTNYYVNSMQTNYEMWEIIKEQFPNKDENSSLLSWADYNSNYKGMLCFDLSRLRDQRLINPVQNCNLSAQILRSDSVAIDRVYVVEKEMKCRVSFSSSETKMIYGAVIPAN